VSGGFGDMRKIGCTSSESPNLRGVPTGEYVLQIHVQVRGEANRRTGSADVPVRIIGDS
jgi:hypothetical protein